MTRALRLVAVSAALAACGGGSDLEPSDVTAIPDGDATGSAASGDYDFTLYTTACRGRCPLIDVGIGVVSLCDVGDLDDRDAEVTQRGGHLDMRTPGLVPERLAGGLDADGAFVVGGWGTQYGARIVVRAEGALGGDRFAGTVEVRRSGTIEDTSFDCTSEHELTGALRGE